MISAPIDRVRVYRRGATVTRRLVVQSPIPDHIEVPGLPLSLVDSTVQVRSLEASVVAGAVRIGLHAKPPESTPDTPDELALRTVRRRIEALQHRLSLLSAESDLLRDLHVPERPDGEEGKPPPPSPMRARVALEQFTDSAIQDRLEEARELRLELEVKREEETALLDVIARASLARKARADQLTKTVITALTGDADQVTLEIEYFVQGARWAPQYQCDIAPDGSEATIKLRALVCQASGEDWRDVALELSTAEPRSFSELPELASVRIGKAQPVPQTRGYRDPPQGAGALFADYDRERRRTQGLLPARSRLSLPTLSIAALLDIPCEPEPAVEPRYPNLGSAVVGGALREEAAEMVMPAPAMKAAAPPPPQPRAKKSAKRRAVGERRRQDTFDDVLEDEAEEDSPGASRPAFSRLRLGPASSGRRSTLHLADAQEDYLGLLGRAGLQVDFDVLSTVRQAATYAASASDVRLPSGSVDVGVISGHFDYAYRADDRVDLPSDLAFHSVPLGNRQAPCSVTYVVVPRVDPNVFRIAAIHNPTDAPLLPGPAEVYVGGEYVLSTTLPVVAPKERFRLGLGVEQGIRCSRNTRFREERAGTNVVAMAELHHEIAIELDNQLPRAIQCEVRERLPQPDKDAEVDVEEIEVQPPWKPWTQEEIGPKLNGGRRWRVEVEPHSKTSVNAHYVVKIYANNEVVGGNRREA